MKQYLKHQNLPWLTLVAGAAGILLRLWLNATENEKGFISRGHISAIALLVLSAGFLILLWLACRYLQQADKYRFNFPASTAGFVGALLAAVGIGGISISELLSGGDLFAAVTALMGILSAAALCFVGHSRWKGLHPAMLFHGLICVYLMLRLICMYRSWSSDPQLADYTFELLALVCAMLAAYHRATFDANFGRRRSYTFFNLAGVYFCCLSLAGPGQIPLFLGLGAWLFTNQCSLVPMPKECWEKK